MTTAPVVPTFSARLPVRLLLFGLVAVLAFWVGFLAFDVNQSRILVQRYGYYSMTLTFAWAVIAWWRVRSDFRFVMADWSPREFWRLATVTTLCTLVAALTVRGGYKILYDEMVLQATASDMHFFREVSTVMRAYTVDGVFVPLDTYLDKRPFFFPYLVSLLHDLFGYREANAFALNTAVFGLTLMQVYLIARRFACSASSLAAVVALGTLSSLAHSGTSAGMEMVNLAMILAVIQFAIFYIDDPSDHRLSALILAAVLLAQTRYESSLYVVPVALVAVEGWRRAGKILLPPSAICAPALLVPYAIHNTYLSGTPALWELKENAHARFGTAQLWENLRHAIGYFFNVNPTLTNSLWLSVAGFAGLGYVTVFLWRRRAAWRAASGATVACVLFALAIGANLLVLMFYYWGQLDDPTVTRLALPFAALLALALAFTIEAFDAPRRHLALIACCAAVLSYFASGLIANAQHTRLNTLRDELAWELRYTQSLAPGERLMITNKSALPWMLARIPAISIEHARRRVDELRFQLADHTFSDLLVFQTYRPTSAKGDFQLDPADRLPDWFVLEPIAEKRFGARLARVSRLVAIQPGPAAAPTSSIPATSTPTIPPKR